MAISYELKCNLKYLVRYLVKYLEDKSTMKNVLNIEIFMCSYFKHIIKDNSMLKNRESIREFDPLSHSTK